ncbi:MAG: F0F1 ATP synthase subunit epsilon [Alphaproteobacteria bacterium]
MADKLHFELVSPERLLKSGEADMVTVPGSEGDFGVLAGHAPFISTIRPGVVTVSDGNAEERIFVRGGFADVTPAGLTLLAEEAIPMGELDAAKLAQDIKDAEEDVNDAKDDAARAEAATHLEQLRQIEASL